MKKCVTCDKELSGLQRKYCSTQCKGKQKQYNSYLAQQERGKKRKLLLIQENGGECCKCGYSRNYSALEFHHINDKKFQLDLRSLSNRSMSSIREEMSKCILICSNCHRELHHPECALTS